MSEIKLTLNPTPTAPATETAVAPAAPEVPAASENIQEPQFTPEEQAQFDASCKTMQENFDLALTL